MVSCAKGAVSRKWYDAGGVSDECKDGCAEDRTARCVDGACAAFWSGGKVDPDCTRK
jgi:hypothetical protein